MLTRTALFVLLIAIFAPAAGKTLPAYQKGTLTRVSDTRKSYELKGPGTDKYFSNCGDFQTGQVVDYRVEGEKVYIRAENGKEYKCSVTGTSMDSNSSKGPPTYQKGTITGWDTRVEAGQGGGHNSLVFTHRQRTRIYELRGADFVYQVDTCGSFQAGQFTAGQVVDYRVDDADKNDKRIYILRDNGKEYSCIMEGVRTIEGAKSEAPAAAVPPAKQ